MKKTLILIAVLALVAVALTTLFRKRTPLEKVGREMDKAGESIKDAVTPDGPVEKAGKKIDKVVDAVKDGIKN
jgi:hypothetical protein